VIADLPGLVPGAASGRGLGHQFLRHTERTRLLVHVLDLDPGSGRDPLDDLHVIDAELAAYSAELAARPQIVAANKVDLAPTDDAGADVTLRRVRVERFCAERGLPCYTISAATGAGLRELVHGIAVRLEATGWLRVAS
jgi:GTP-binding protein